MTDAREIESYTGPRWLFTKGLLKKHPDGDYVSYADYESQRADLAAKDAENAKQADEIERLNKEWEEAALLIGVCGAGKCNAGMWADPPRDCDAPNCLDLIAGIKKAKDQIEQLQARVKESESVIGDLLPVVRHGLRSEEDKQAVVRANNYWFAIKAINHPGG